MSDKSKLDQVQDDSDEEPVSEIPEPTLKSSKCPICPKNFRVLGKCFRDHLREHCKNMSDKEFERACKTYQKGIQSETTDASSSTNVLKDRRSSDVNGGYQYRAAPILPYHFLPPSTLPTMIPLPRGSFVNLNQSIILPGPTGFGYLIPVPFRQQIPIMPAPFGFHFPGSSIAFQQNIGITSSFAFHLPQVSQIHYPGFSVTSDQGDDVNTAQRLVPDALLASMRASLPSTTSEQRPPVLPTASTSQLQKLDTDASETSSDVSENSPAHPSTPNDESNIAEKPETNQ